MNLELLDPFAKTVPDHVDSVLSYGVEDATVCCFDKRGAYLAVGYATGIVVIWDFVTRGIGRVIEAHARGITALSWARGGRRLLSASHDQRLHYWALEPARPELIRVICLAEPIMSALMLPGKYPRALALTTDGKAHLVDIKENTTKTACATDQSFTLSPSKISCMGNADKKAKLSSASNQAAAPAILCLTLDRRASRVCLGTSNGKVLAVGIPDGKISSPVSIAGCTKVTQLDFSRDGKWMLVNGGERVIRMLERENTTGRSVRDFQDVVNRTRWQCCRFTGDSEYIAGGSRAETTCSIYIWTVEGHLVTRLEGPNLGLLSLTRHPVRPFLAAALTTGKVQLWGTTHAANWTAFATDFEELEENVEYVEKEDEFDVVVDAGDPGGHKRMAEKEQEEEEAVVTIDAIDTVPAWSSDSEGESSRELFYLSTEPGAAAREGWYDLEVQTSKKPFASAPEGGRSTETEKWKRVRVGGSSASSGNLEAEEGGKPTKKASKKKKVYNREFGKRSKSHKSHTDPSKSKTTSESKGGEGATSIRESTLATSSGERNRGNINGKNSNTRSGVGSGVDNEGKIGTSKESLVPATVTSTTKDGDGVHDASNRASQDPLPLRTKETLSGDIGDGVGTSSGNGGESRDVNDSPAANRVATEKRSLSPTVQNERPEKRRKEDMEERQQG